MLKFNYDLKEMSDRAYILRDNSRTNFLDILFIMTSECNFRCTYCYEYKQPGSLKLESAKYLLKKLFSIEENADYWNGFFGNTEKDIIVLDFFGGECLLEIDNMDAICDYFIELCDADLSKYQKRKDNMGIHIQTNGSLLKTPKVLKFLNKWKDRITDLFITTDGSKNSHDACRVFKDTKKPTWDVVSENILYIRKEFPMIPISTKGTITPQNVKYLYESYLEYQNLGFENVRTTIATGIDWDKESLDILSEQLKLISDDLLKNHLYDNITFDIFEKNYIKNRCEYNQVATMGCGECGTSGSAITITPRDEYCLCHLYTYLSRSDNKTFAIGNVRDGITDSGLENIVSVKKFVPPNNATTQKCIQCPDKIMCSYCGGMAYASYSGKFDDLMTFEHNIQDCDALRIVASTKLIYQYKRETALCNRTKELQLK